MILPRSRCYVPPITSWPTQISTMEAAPVFASTAISSGLPPVPGSRAGPRHHLRPRQPRLNRRSGEGSQRLGLPAAAGNRPRHRRPEISDRPPPHRADRQRPRPARRRARPGQDARPAHAGRGGAGPVPAHPVHARHAAGRHRRHADLQSARRHLQPEARPGLRQFRPGRRNQPRARQGAERAARSDAGTAGHPRRKHLRSARAVPRHGHAKPDRAGGHLSPARSAGRPLHAQDRRRPIPRAPRSAASSTRWRRPRRISPCSRW